MVINLRKLIGLPVYTAAGVKLGRIADAELDVEKHLVARYVVKAGAISLASFLVQYSQVVSITEEKMVVDDSVSAERVSIFGRPALEE